MDERNSGNERITRLGEVEELQVPGTLNMGSWDCSTFNPGRRRHMISLGDLCPSSIRKSRGAAIICGAAVHGCSHHAAISEQRRGGGQPSGEVDIILCSLAVGRTGPHQNDCRAYRRALPSQRTADLAATCQRRLFPCGRLESDYDCRRRVRSLRVRFNVSRKSLAGPDRQIGKPNYAQSAESNPQIREGFHCADLPSKSDGQTVGRSVEPDPWGTFAQFGTDSSNQFRHGGLLIRSNTISEASPARFGNESQAEQSRTDP